MLYFLSNCYILMMMMKILTIVALLAVLALSAGIQPSKLK